MRIKRIVSWAAAAAFLALTGCGSLNSAISASGHYLGTQAPGDVWDWNITGTTFTATNQTNGFTYSGTVSTLPTGFLKLQIASTSDPNVTVGSSAYAVEMPGTALILKPAGADTKPPIIAASLGGNPAGPTVSFNFVHVPATNWTPTDEAYGHVTFTVTGNAYDGTSIRFMIDGTPMSDGPSHFTGNNGMMTDVDAQAGINATGAMTPSGVCVIDYGPNNGGVIGVRQPASAVSLADLGSKSYRGFSINQGKTQCVSCAPNGDRTIHGTGYSNPSGVETGTSDGGSGVTVSFLSQPNPGLVRVNIATTGGNEDLVACVNVVAGKTMLFCFGKGNGGPPYNVLLVEQ